MAGTDPVLSSAGYLLLKAGTHFHTVVDEALDGLGLNGRQLLVLTFTGSEDHLSQQMLSVRLGLDPTIIVALVDDLEDRAGSCGSGIRTTGGATGCASRRKAGKCTRPRCGR